MVEGQEHTLAFLLAFDGQIHWYAEGYFAKFEIKQVAATMQRPHGLRYSLTLHAPDGARLMGFDNAHTVPAKGSRYSKRPVEADHWHRVGDDPGRPRPFTDAATLIFDFFGEIERVLIERSVSLDLVETEQKAQKDLS